MAKYCVNTQAQANGDHEVHVLNGTCWTLPKPEHQKDLGEHSSCTTAVAQAKQTYKQSNGCAHCCAACNTG